MRYDIIEVKLNDDAFHDSPYRLQTECVALGKKFLYKRNILEIGTMLTIILYE